MREGFGTFTNVYGNSWEGEWSEGRKHGKMTYFEKTGSTAKIFNQLNHGLAKSMIGEESLLTRDITHEPELAYFEEGAPTKKA